MSKLLFLPRYEDVYQVKLLYYVDYLTFRGGVEAYKKYEKYLHAKIKI